MDFGLDKTIKTNKRARKKENHQLLLMNDMTKLRLIIQQWSWRNDLTKSSFSPTKLYYEEMSMDEIGVSLIKFFPLSLYLITCSVSCPVSSLMHFSYCFSGISMPLWRPSCRELSSSCSFFGFVLKFCFETPLEARELNSLFAVVSAHPHFLSWIISLWRGPTNQVSLEDVTDKRFPKL